MGRVGRWEGCRARILDDDDDMISGSECCPGRRRERHSPCRHFEALAESHAAVQLVGHAEQNIRILLERVIFSETLASNRNLSIVRELSRHRTGQR